MSKYMCPNCGWQFDARLSALVPWHSVRQDDPDSRFVEKRGLGMAEACPGVGQHPRNPESDQRKLWKDGGEP